MELKLFGLVRTPDQPGSDDEGDFVLELTVEQLASVGGGLSHDDESPKESRYH